MPVGSPFAASWAHPRSRGENGRVGGVRFPLVGSSPLTRGKLIFGSLRVMRRGLIPAHAGKTPSSSPTTSPRRAHPRSRGENDGNDAMRPDAPGSSPLTRGKRRHKQVCGHPAGLIPAHAGITQCGRGHVYCAPAHPRSRGENPIKRQGNPSGYGSSPLTRGKPRVARVAGLPGGLIPAHAGKTQPPTARPVAGWAHPRSRGENSAPATATRRPSGSSPLTRGKLKVFQLLDGNRGLIPAHAGKTGITVCMTEANTAHPRSRGENAIEAGKKLAADGSSPLTRGKLYTYGAAATGQRLIPAHAGKTRDEGAAKASPRAHPRSRGENPQSPSSSATSAGSSPLTRGKPDPAHHDPARAGLIPAHAGKTHPNRPDRREARAHPRSRGENT